MKRLLLFILAFWCHLAYSQDSINAHFIQLLNAHREAHGLSSVVYSSLADSASKLHSEWMSENRTLQHNESPRKNGEFYYSHQNRLDFFDPDWNSEYDRYYCLENCAQTVTWNSLKLEDIRHVFDLWVSSPGHNAALLAPNITAAAIAISVDYSSFSDLALLRIYSTAVFLKKNQKVF